MAEPWGMCAALWAAQQYPTFTVQKMIDAYMKRDWEEKDKEIVVVCEGS